MRLRGAELPLLTGLPVAAGIAITPDAAREIVLAYALGAGVFGGGMTVLLGALIAFGYGADRLRRRRTDGRVARDEAREEPQPVSHLRLKLAIAAAVIGAVIGITWLADSAEAMAYYAGFGLGSFVAFTILSFVSGLHSRPGGA